MKITYFGQFRIFKKKLFALFLGFINSFLRILTFNLLLLMSESSNFVHFCDIFIQAFAVIFTNGVN